MCKLRAIQEKHLHRTCGPLLGYASTTVVGHACLCVRCDQFNRAAPITCGVIPAILDIS
jgi:hypothetical protein